ARHSRRVGANLRGALMPVSWKTLAVVPALLASFQPLAADPGKERPVTHPTLYRTVQIDGLSIFYREAGPKDAPVLLLLHGLPSSSRMFEPLFSRLSDRYHLIAPDYPGFGHSIVIHNYRWRLGLA